MAKGICPNLSDPQIKAEFDEMVAALGEKQAYAIWDMNNGYSLDKAPNGEPSILFNSLLEHNNQNRVNAIQAKAKVYTNSFKAWFGDWTSNTLPSKYFQGGKIIFGHPGIGKTYSIEKGKYADRFIDWDVEYNVKRDKWIEQHSGTKKGTPEYKKARNEYLVYPDRHPDYIQFLTDEWNRVKDKAKKQNKVLLVSPHTL